MESNCLVKNLKGVVNKPSLEKLGLLDIEFYDQGSVIFSQTQQIKLQNGTFKSTGTNVKEIAANTQFYFTNNSCTLDSGETTYKVEVPKYHLTGVLNIEKDVIDLDFLYKWSDSDYCVLYVIQHQHNAYISHANNYTSKFGGQFVAVHDSIGITITMTEMWDVTQLGVSGLLTRLYIPQLGVKNITGSFDNLGKSPLTEIVFPNGKIDTASFNIENFVRNNVAAGRTTYSISNLAHPGAANTTFKGSLLTNDVTINYSISWSPNATAGKTDIVITNKSTGASDSETIDNVV